jgi:hypothetical protein
VLALIEEPVFLWNVFPLHPHERGDPFSNRTHSRIEGKVGEEFLAELLRMLRPRKVVAIGNDAKDVAMRVANLRDVLGVRHPSYGGQAKFLRQLKSAYGV